MRQFGFCLSALVLVGIVNGQDVLRPLVVTGEREERASGNVEVEVIDAERISELLGHVAGFGAVTSDSAGFGDTLSVRGSANTLFFGGAGVALVVDDVPFGDVFTYSTEFFDLDSFTLHRGPQGSRFGRNGAGGLIELHTAGPTETQEYHLSTEYGSDDLFSARFRASGPLNDRWSYVFQSYFKERNGFIDNENPAVGGFNDTREQFGALGNLYYQPSSDLKVRFRGLYERVRDGSQRLTALPGVPSAFGPLDGLRAQNAFEVTSDFEGVTEVDRFQLSLHLDHDLRWAKFKSITSYQNWELSPSTVDLDLSPVAASTSSINQEQEVFSQEFRLESDVSEDVHWTAGLAYLRKDTDGSTNRFFGTSAFTFSDQFTDFSVDEDNIALYGNVRWDASEKLSFELGGRLEYVESELSRSRTDLGNTPGFPSVIPTITGESDGLYFAPSLDVRYALNNEVSLFARTSTSFKPQGFTAFSDNASNSEFDEEFAWETEIGLSYKNAAETLGFEVRGYYKQIDDYQLNTSVPFTTDFIILNADRVEAIGVEADLYWKPLERLTVRGSVAVNQIEFDAYTGISGDDLSGNDVPFLPEYTASLTARYDFESGFYAEASYRLIGTTYFEESNDSDFSQGAYRVLDAQVGYQAETWNAAFFIRNALDEEFFTFQNNQITAGALGDPQVVGVRLGLEF